MDGVIVAGVAYVRKVVAAGLNLAARKLRAAMARGRMAVSVEVRRHQELIEVPRRLVVRRRPDGFDCYCDVVDRLDLSRNSRIDT